MLRSSKSVAAGRGPVCRARVRKAAADLQAALKPEQHAKMLELIEDGGIQRTSRPGVYAATSSDGSTVYVTDATAGTCTCKAGEAGRRCYHVAAAQLLTLAVRRAA
jgi:hypothetical protein